MSGVRAYLDIEMTFEWSITVVGIYRHDRGTVQLCGPAITDVAIYDALAGAATIGTFNGAGCDLLWLRRRLAIDLNADYAHDDLMVRGRRRGIRGGLKQIEQQYGIARRSAGWLPIRITLLTAPFICATIGLPLPTGIGVIAMLRQSSRLVRPACS